MGHFALSYQISNRLRDVSQTPGTLELAEKKMNIFFNQNKCGKFSYKGAVELRCQSTPSILTLSLLVGLSSYLLGGSIDCGLGEGGAGVPLSMGVSKYSNEAHYTGFA